MSGDQSHFIARRLEDHKRATQRALHCHLCTQTLAQFRGEKEFLEHCQQIHHEIIVDAPNGKVWRNAVQQAASKAKQRDVGKLQPQAYAVSKKSSNDSMKLNYGDESVSQPSSFSAIPARSTDAKIDEFKRLSLEQKTPAVTPSKRSAGLGLLAPEQTRNRVEIRTSPKTRRTRGGLLGDGRASNTGDGRAATPSTVEYQRSQVHAQRKLYDPNVNDIPYGKTHSLQQPRSQPSYGASQRRRVDTPISSKDFHHQQHRSGHHHHHHHRTHSGGLVTSSQSHTGGLRTIPVHIEEPPSAGAWEEEEPELLLQPEVKHVTAELLTYEVDNLYAGLELVEAKCIDVDEKQLQVAQSPDPSKRTTLTKGQWGQLIRLHKTLLGEHQDFFVAIQHPSADEKLTKRAEERSMPARMWKHGIHTFLEVLRLHLPDSFEFMITYLYISYSTMALLYETVPMFEDIWVECLGDLGRYRMAVGDNDHRDKEVWAGVARLWYGRAWDKHPETGRLLHHIGILAKPYSISQLGLYCRSVGARVPFQEGKASILTMFKPVLAGRLSTAIRQNSLETLLVKCLGILATAQLREEYVKSYKQITFDGMLGKYCDRAGSKFKEVGVTICVSVLTGLLEFGATRPDGSSRSIIRRALEKTRKNKILEGGVESREVNQPISLDLTSEELEMSANTIIYACKVAFGILDVGLQRTQDRNIMPMIHTFTACLKTITSNPTIMEYVENEVPWSRLVAYLNHFANSSTITKIVLGLEFPKPEEDAIGRPLPEDYIMRGQELYYDYFNPTWFTDADLDDEEKLLELPSMTAPRMTRILWNGIRIAAHEKWIVFDQETCKFVETPYAQSLKPKELPKVFAAGIPSDLIEIHVPESDVVDSSTTTSKASVKSEPSDRESNSLTDSPRQIFTQTPKILKRESKPETAQEPGITPTKGVQVASPNRMDLVNILHPEDT